MPQMENYEPLDYPKSIRRANLHPTCGYCKMNVGGGICKENGRHIKYCEHLDKHYFKVYANVPGSDNKRKTKKLETRDANEAIKMAIDFEREVKKAIPQDYRSREIEKEIIKNDENIPYLLIHILARYVAWLKNEGVPKSLAIHRTNDHLKDVERASLFLIQYLSSSGRDVNAFSVEKINRNLVGEVIDALREKGLSNRTINKYLTYYTSALKWYSEEFNFPVKNHFKQIRYTLNPKPQAITKKEYEALLKIITPENGVRFYKGVKTKRSFYRYWLRNAFMLALETGRRREEIVRLRWNEVNILEGLITALDLKVNRIQHRNEEEEKKMIHIPITPDLMELLIELGYEKYKDTDKYILAPEDNMSRGRVTCDILSRGFSHYYSQLQTGRTLTFKDLRKTYATGMQRQMGDNSRYVLGHSSNEVKDRNYIFKKEMAKKGRNAKVFEDEIDRKNELEDFRNEIKSNQQNRELNR